MEIKVQISGKYSIPGQEITIKLPPLIYHKNDSIEKIYTEVTKQILALKRR